MTFHVPEQLRWIDAPSGYNSTKADGNNGVFRWRSINIMASDGTGWTDGPAWEHVSASCKDRVPNWEEMCRIKAMFWDDEDCVVQFHPPRSDYVNMHPHTLHLWRPVGQELPRPPSIMVGWK